MKRRGPLAIRSFGTALCSVALAATPALAATTSKTLKFTGAEQQFVVPAAVTSVSIKLVGGSGGGTDSGASDGGVGATIVARLAVTPGEVLFVEVGGNGVPGAGFIGGAGGLNGGGSGATGHAENPGIGNPHGGGGGGATDIRTCSTKTTTAGDPPTCATLATVGSRLVVAAGGGGAGGGSGPTLLGGDGGPAGSAGSTGTADSAGDHGGTGGQPGGPSSGGAAGLHTTTGPPNPGSQLPTAGTLGAGGMGGGTDAAFGDYGGGGGGGGIYGGGGAGGGDGSVNSNTPYEAAGGGGGGGSSGIPAGVSGVSGFSTEATATGTAPSAKLTWTKPRPTAVTGAVGAVTQTSAQLTGTVNPDASQVSDCHFTIAPAPASGATVPCAQQVGSGQQPVAVGANAAGLSPSTAYTVTLSATSAQGTDTGAPVTFTTAGSGSPPPPNASPPTKSHASITGVAARKPRLAFTAVAGKNAPPLESLTVGLPHGLSFSRSKKSIARGITVKSAAGKRVKLSAVLVHGKLTITLKAAATRAAVTIAAPTLAASGALANKVKHRHAAKLGFSLKLVDSRGHATTLSLKLRPK